LTPSYAPDSTQQTLKSASGAARAEVIAAELFRQLDVAMDGLLATLDLGF
jgi:hypothetical protein